MPAPMIAPMPSIVRLSAPELRLRLCSPVASASARSAVIGLGGPEIHRRDPWLERRGAPDGRSVNATGGEQASAPERSDAGLGD